MARSHLFAVAAAAATLSLNLSAHASLLQNPDLELGPDSNTATGWTLVETYFNDTGMFIDTASFQSFANHEPGGSRGLWFKSFEGGQTGNPDTVDATLYQDVPATPGVEYTLSAWFKQESGFSGQSQLAMVFLTQDDIPLGFNLLDADSMVMNGGDWTQLSINSVAPALTEKVRVGVIMSEGMNSQMNPQSAFVDDFTLIPAPGVAVLGLMGAAGLRSRNR